MTHNVGSLETQVWVAINSSESGAGLLEAPLAKLKCSRVSLVECWYLCWEGILFP